jgi:hypothetical protein
MQASLRSETEGYRASRKDHLGVRCGERHVYHPIRLPNHERRNSRRYNKVETILTSARPPAPLLG